MLEADQKISPTKEAIVNRHQSKSNLSALTIFIWRRQLSMILTVLKKKVSQVSKLLSFGYRHRWTRKCDDAALPRIYNNVYTTTMLQKLA